MAVLWLAFRSSFRPNWRSWAALTLLVGLAGGVVIGAAAGARRTDSSYARFLAVSNPSDVMVQAVPFPLDFEAVNRLPEVEFSYATPYLFLNPAPGEPEVDLSAILTPDYREVTADRSKVLAGRRPDPDNPHEVSVNSVTWRQGVGVGSVLRLQAWTPEGARALLQGDREPPDGIVVELEVVGVEIAPGQLLPSENDEGSILVTPAFDRQYGSQIGRVDIQIFRLRNGTADIASFKEGVERIAGDRPPQFATLNEDTAQVQRSIHLQAVSLQLFAVLAAVASLLILGQALGRQAFVEAADQPTYAALGLTRTQRWLAAMLRPLAISMAGAAIAGVIAALSSPLLPFGLARDAEPDPGFAFDAAAVLVGVAATVVFVVAVSAFPIWRATRTAASLRSLASDQPSRLAEALARVGVRPSTLTGFRMAVEPGRGTSSVPTRAALAGTALSVLALVMAVTFGTSLDHLVDTPRLYGWNWDAVVGSAFLEDISEPVVAALGDSPLVAGLAGIQLAETDVGGVRTPVFGFTTVRGAASPPVISGRAPEQPDEIVLGGKTMDRVGARIGALVDIRAGEVVRQVRVVGRGVLPALSGGDIAGLGEGAFLTGEGFARLYPDAPVNMFAVRLAAGVSEEEAGEALGPLAEEVGVNLAAPPKRVADFGRVDNMPVVLAGLLGLIATATLIHTLVSAVRRRRHDLAILKTLGFVKAQVRSTVAWQATTLTVFALLVGIPLGVAAGRWSWHAFAEDLGTVPEPVVPLLVVSLTVPLAVLVANAVAALPARAAARTRPALILRSE